MVELRIFRTVSSRESKPLMGPQYRIWSPQSAMAVEDYTIHQLGIDSAVLIERAALGVAHAMKERGFLNARTRVEVCCGPGNNGADGLALARILHLRGYPVVARLVTQNGNAAREQQRRWAQRVGVSIVVGSALSAEQERAQDVVYGEAALSTAACRSKSKSDECSDASEEIAFIEAKRPPPLPIRHRPKAPKRGYTGDVIYVDAMLGTGYTGALRGDIAQHLSLDEVRSQRWVAIDLPTGVDGRNGTADPHAVVAEMTVTMGALKMGLVSGLGRRLAGSIEIVSIGLVPAEPSFADGYLIDPSWVYGQLKQARRADHKHQRGHVMVIGGSEGMRGAARLCALAGMRAGAGLCTVSSWSPDDSLRPRETELWEPSDAVLMSRRIQTPLKDEDLEPAFGVLVFGPGLRHDDAETLGLRRLFQEDPRPAVWDAGALSVLREGLQPKGARVLTPHPGEAARLCRDLEIEHPDQREWNSNEVQRYRACVVRAIARASRAVVVLKGAGTMVSDGDGLWVCASGSDALATAGSGDVLAGMVAAWLARGSSALEAALIAVELHARAGQRLGDAVSGAIASDLLNEIKVVMQTAERENADLGPVGPSSITWRW